MKKFNTIIVLVIFYYLLIIGVLNTVDAFAQINENDGRINLINAVIWLIGTTSFVGAGVIGAIQNSNSLRLSEADDRPLISDETKEKAMTQLVEARVLRMVLIGIGLFAVLIYFWVRSTAHSI